MNCISLMGHYGGCFISLNICLGSIGFAGIISFFCNFRLLCDEVTSLKEVREASTPRLSLVPFRLNPVKPTDSLVSYYLPSRFFMGLIGLRSLEIISGFGFGDLSKSLNLIILSSVSSELSSSSASSGSSDYDFDYFFSAVKRKQ